MSKEKRHQEVNGEVIELLKSLLIAQLAAGGVPQKEIREIVGGDIVRVNRIAKYFRKDKAKEGGNVGVTRRGKR